MRTASWVTGVFSVAMENSHFGVVKFLVEQGYCSPLRSVYTVNKAVRSENLEMVKWTCALPLDPSSLCVTEIPASYSIWCHCGHFRSTQKYAYVGIKWLEKLKLVSCLGLGYSSRLAMKITAQCGHLGIIQWLHEARGHACTVDAMEVATTKGHLSVLEHLYSRWCDWFGLLSLNFPDATLEKAAASGHLEVVKWLREKQPNQCPMEVMIKAVEKRHLEVAQWLCQNRNEGCLAKAVEDAATNGRPYFAMWLHTNQCKSCGNKGRENRWFIADTWQRFAGLKRIARQLNR